MDFQQNGIRRGTLVKSELFDQIFWDVQLNNKYIALAINHIHLSQYMEEKLGYSPKGTEGRFIKYLCPFCREEFLYVDDSTGLYYTQKCNRRGRLYDLKMYFEKKSKEQVADELECLGNSLEEKIHSFTRSYQTETQGENKFKIGLSFAGEYREFVISKIAEALLNHFNKSEILYDKFHEEEFGIPNLNEHLLPYYRMGCDLIAVFVCKEYKEKYWCRQEWRNILSRQEEIKDDNRLILFHFDDTELNGFNQYFDGSIFIGCSSEDVRKAVDCIIDRYNRIILND